MTDLWCHSQLTVYHYSQVSCSVDDWRQNWHLTDLSLDCRLSGAQPQNLRLGGIQKQPAGTHSNFESRHRENSCYINMPTGHSGYECMDGWLNIHWLTFTQHYCVYHFYYLSLSCACQLLINQYLIWSEEWRPRTPRAPHYAVRCFVTSRTYMHLTLDGERVT